MFSCSKREGQSFSDICAEGQRPSRGRSAGPHFSAMRNGGKNRLGRSPLRTSLGYEAAPAVVLRPARDPCCGPCYCHHTRLSWQLALSPGGFHLRAYLGKRRSRRWEPYHPSLGTAAYQGKALRSRSTIRQRSRCCLSCLQAIYVTHPGPGPKPGGRRCIPYRGVDSTRRGKAPPLVGLW